MNLLLAADCFGEIRNRESIKSISQQLLYELQEKADLKYKIVLSPSAARSICRAIAAYYTDELEVLEWLKSRAEADHNEYMRQAAVWAISAYYSEHPDTLPWVQKCFYHTKACSIRFAVVSVLTEYFQGHSEAFELLCYAAVDDWYVHERQWRDYPSRIRKTALEACLAHYSNYSKTFELLCDRATSDPDPQLREWAQQQLEKLELYKKA